MATRAHPSWLHQPYLLSHHGSLQRLGHARSILRVSVSVGDGLEGARRENGASLSAPLVVYYPSSSSVRLSSAKILICSYQYLIVQLRASETKKTHLSLFCWVIMRLIGWCLRLCNMKLLISDLSAACETHQIKSVQRIKLSWFTACPLLPVHNKAGGNLFSHCHCSARLTHSSPTSSDWSNYEDCTNMLLCLGCFWSKCIVHRVQFTYIAEIFRVLDNFQKNKTHLLWGKLLSDTQTCG